jgi:ferrochelatase
VAARDSDSRIGVVLLQLGGPDSLEAVEPFLYNLFCDPDIIDLPGAFLFRKGLARLISTRRGPKVQEIYRSMGGRSPILKLTARQAAALERALAPDLPAKTYIAMRYWHPFTDVTVDQIVRDGIRRVVLLPLYPQFSKSTTGSSVREWERVLRAKGVTTLTSTLVSEYCEHPGYIRAIVRSIGYALRRIPEAGRRKTHLVFSAHGTPMSLVRSGDPYQSQIVRTYNAVVRAGDFGLPHHLCYQSKVGPQQWLEPSLVNTIDRLAADGVSHMVVVPIAFVSDHSETLVEINMEARHQARERGVRHFDMSPALNACPPYVEALADVVRRSVGGMA